MNMSPKQMNTELTEMMVKERRARLGREFNKSQGEAPRPFSMPTFYAILILVLFLLFIAGMILSQGLLF